MMVIDLLHMPNGRYRGQTWAGVDFHTYLAAALVGLQHGWFEIYDQGLVRSVQGRLVPNQFTQPFLSPPVDSWLAAPLYLPLPLKHGQSGVSRRGAVRSTHFSTL